MEADPYLVLPFFPANRLALLRGVVASLVTIVPTRSSLIDNDPPEEVSFRALHFGFLTFCAHSWSGLESGPQIRSTAERVSGLVPGLPSICLLPDDVFLILLVEDLTYSISRRPPCRSARRRCFKSCKSIQWPAFTLALEPVAEDLGWHTAPCGIQNRRSFLDPLQSSPFRMRRPHHSSPLQLFAPYSARFPCGH